MNKEIWDKNPKSDPITVDEISYVKALLEGRPEAITTINKLLRTISAQADMIADQIKELDEIKTFHNIIRTHIHDAWFRINTFEKSKKKAK